MKPFIISIAFCLLCISQANAQYKSIFGNTSTAWIFTWSNLPGTVRDSAYVQKDTIVNGKTYKKIISKYSSSYKGALLREDTATGKVWHREIITTSGNPYDTIEAVAFQYSLNPGDTFTHNNFFYVGVDTVDSVKVISGLRYIYFKKQYYSEPLTFIEGVGSNLGVICKASSFMTGRYLLCSYKDGIKTIHQNKRYNGNCQPELSVQNIDKQQKITLYPNPANGFLNIKNSTLEKIKFIQFYSIQGKLVLEFQNPSNLIDLQHLSFGTYLVRIQTISGLSFNQTINIL